MLVYSRVWQLRIGLTRVFSWASPILCLWFLTWTGLIQRKICRKPCPWFKTRAVPFSSWNYTWFPQSIFGWVQDSKIWVISHWFPQFPHERINIAGISSLYPGISHSWTTPVYSKLFPPDRDMSYCATWRSRSQWEHCWDSPETGWLWWLKYLMAYQCESPPQHPGSSSNGSTKPRFRTASIYINAHHVSTIFKGFGVCQLLTLAVLMRYSSILLWFNRSYEQSPCG